MPLVLEVRGVPAVSPVDARIDLVVRLTNPLAKPVLVNRRLLLVPTGMPEEFGELMVRVSGPSGYRNEREIHVRAGLPRPEDFVVLLPGQAVEQTITLWRYESLHVVGMYSLAVAYYNTVPFALEGHTAIVGVTTAHTTVERTASPLLR